MANRINTPHENSDSDKMCSIFNNKTVPSGDVLSPSEPKTLKPPEDKRKKSNDKSKRLDKIGIVLRQHYYAVNAIGSSIQELVYLNLVFNAIITKEVIRNEEIIFLDMR